MSKGKDGGAPAMTPMKRKLRSSTTKDELQNVWEEAARSHGALKEAEDSDTIVVSPRPQRAKLPPVQAKSETPITKKPRGKKAAKTEEEENIEVPRGTQEQDIMKRAVDAETSPFGKLVDRTIGTDSEKKVDQVGSKVTPREQEAEAPPVKILASNDDETMQDRIAKGETGGRPSHISQERWTEMSYKAKRNARSTARKLGNGAVKS